jgi:hypothetical protein
LAGNYPPFAVARRDFTVRFIIGLSSSLFQNSSECANFVCDGTGSKSKVAGLAELVSPKLKFWNSLNKLYFCFFHVRLKQNGSTTPYMTKHLDGHVWGDRYWSAVLEGELPEDGIFTGKPVRGDCGENAGEGRPAEGETGGQTMETRPRKGPPGGDSRRDSVFSAGSGHGRDVPVGSVRNRKLGIFHCGWIL